MRSDLTDRIGAVIAERWSRAVRALGQGDRAAAERALCDALEWSRELVDPGPYELCWRAMLLHQRASNLDRLEGPPAEARAALALWRELLAVATRVDREARTVFLELHGFDLCRAAEVAQRALLEALDRASRDPWGLALGPGAPGGDAER